MSKMAKRRAETTVRAVRAVERSLGVKLKRTPQGFYLAVLPQDHPLAKKLGNNRLLLAVKDVERMAHD